MTRPPSPKTEAMAAIGRARAYVTDLSVAALRGQPLSALEFDLVETVLAHAAVQVDAIEELRQKRRAPKKKPPVSVEIGGR